MGKGKYIVIEGSDGSGKGTQCAFAERYIGETIQVESTREPGGTIMGEHIRSLLKSVDTPRDPRTNVDLFSISRRESAQQIIRPALHAGKVVLSDRNYFSTIAYQGFGEGLDVGYILDRTKDALDDLMEPDLALVLNVPYQILEERIRLRGCQKADYFESKDSDFFKRVCEGYDWICENLGARSVDASGTYIEVWDNIRKELDKELE